uniref:Uncharacterized protein n=1 Tax=Medicago truncatula TaxID=3880 RepID=A2Q1G5_MEDTR|nr:hypothetical protein MtrDRAFT_AC148816g28v2 [Medicago truncatula]
MARPSSSAETGNLENGFPLGNSHQNFHFFIPIDPKSLYKLHQHITQAKRTIKTH